MMVFRWFLWGRSGVGAFTFSMWSKDVSVKSRVSWINGVDCRAFELRGMWIYQLGFKLAKRVKWSIEITLTSWLAWGSLREFKWCSQASFVPNVVLFTEYASGYASWGKTGSSSWDWSRDLRHAFLSVCSFFIRDEAFLVVDYLFVS